VTAKEGLTILSTTESVRNDGKVEEMIIGWEIANLRACMEWGPEFPEPPEALCLYFECLPCRPLRWDGLLGGSVSSNEGALGRLLAN